MKTDGSSGLPAAGLTRQAILRAPRELDLVERPVPLPGPGEVVVRVRAALTCGTDLKTYRQGHPRVAFGPFGHEASGEIASVGEGVGGFAVGQPVAFVHTAPCGKCGPCVSGRENHCATLLGEMALGAYGDHLCLPARIVRRHLFPKPERLSYIEAAFLEPLACVVHSWERLGPVHGNVVAVVGLGAAGQLHVSLAKRRGHRVIAVGRRDESLDLALRAGADGVVNSAEEDVGGSLRDLTGEGPEVVIECTGSAAVWREAPVWAAPGGRVLLFGGLPGGSEPAFDATRLHYGEVDLVGTFHYRTSDVVEALRLLASGEISPRGLISGTRPLEAIREVFSDLDRGIGLKYAVLPDGGEWR